jgi:two-component system OmpR family response regulator
MTSLKGKTILVVEDDADSRAAICTILESMGIHPIGFASGKAALSGMTGKKFDLALLDIMMPEMDGYQLLREMRQMPDFRDLPVIMVTAKDQDSEILEGYQFGADYYIPKPFTAKQLEYGIRLFLSKEK